MAAKNYFLGFWYSILAKLGKKTPIKVSHFITNACDCKCGFCLAKDLPRRGEMSLKQVKKIMLDFKKQGTQLWDICGGEPLLRKDLYEIVKYGKKLGFIVNIVTNGRGIKEHLEALRLADDIMISLDGPREIHDKIRGQNTFDKVVEGVELLKKNGKKPILNMVITKENYQYINDMIKLSEEKGVFIDFSPVVACTLDSNEHTLEKKKLNEVVREILELKKQKKFIVTSTSYLKRTLKYNEGEINRFQGNCLAGKTYCVLSPEGKIAPCLVRFNEGRAGEVKESFNLLKEKGCDCSFRCYYNTNYLHNLSFKVILKSIHNLLTNKWIHT